MTSFEPTDHFGVSESLVDPHQERFSKRIVRAYWHFTSGFGSLPVIRLMCPVWMTGSGCVTHPLCSSDKEEIQNISPGWNSLRQRQWDTPVLRGTTEHLVKYWLKFYPMVFV